MVWFFEFEIDINSQLEFDKQTVLLSEIIAVDPTPSNIFKL